MGRLAFLILSRFPFIFLSCFLFSWNLGPQVLREKSRCFFASVTDQTGVFPPLFWGGGAEAGGESFFFLLLGTLFSTLSYIVNLPDFSPRKSFI